MLQVRNPYNGDILAELAFATHEEIAGTLTRASKAFEKWRHSPAWERAELLNGAAAKLEARREEFAALIRDEAGKPIQYARIEVDRALGVLRWGAAETQRYSGELLRL